MILFIFTIKDRFIILLFTINVKGMYMKLAIEFKKTVKEFIIKNIIFHRNDLVNYVVGHFKLSRPTVTGIIQEMIDEKIIKKNNARGRYPEYQLVTKITNFSYDLVQSELQEDKIYYNDIMPLLDGLPINIIGLFEYSVMEIINNAIDHSDGTRLRIQVRQDVKSVQIRIGDDGIGIFKKIQRDLNLQTPQESILELYKGKFTSDPTRHSGEGIFFSSRMVDTFLILSDGLVFYGHDGSDMIQEYEDVKDLKGTMVILMIEMDTTRTAREVIHKFSNFDLENSFYKTMIPVKIMNVEGGNLVSRSQAKRLCSRFERFTTVVLDFQGVELIGQAFADEVFRVFQNAHKELNLVAINTNEVIDKVIKFVRSAD